jgi:hypothetical protein
MKRLLALATLVVCACTPTRYAYTPSTRGEVPKADGCKFEIFDAAPGDRDYEEIGRLDHYNGPVPKSVDALRSAIHERVCQVGGDAVVADPDTKGEYKSVQVIKFTGVQH